MPPESEQPGSPHAWLRYAEADLVLARVPLPERGLYEHLCFHAQQAAEKSLKAILVKSGIAFPHTHNLQTLIDLLPQEIPRTSSLTSAARLTAYAVSCRYPGIEEPVEESEYREVVNTAGDVVDWATKHLHNNQN